MQKLKMKIFKQSYS